MSDLAVSIARCDVSSPATNRVDSNQAATLRRPHLTPLANSGLELLVGSDSMSSKVSISEKSLVAIESFSELCTEPSLSAVLTGQDQSLRTKYSRAGEVYSSISGIRRHSRGSTAAAVPGMQRKRRRFPVVWGRPCRPRLGAVNAGTTGQSRRRAMSDIHIPGPDGASCRVALALFSRSQLYQSSMPSPRVAESWSTRRRGLTRWAYSRQRWTSNWT